VEGAAFKLNNNGFLQSLWRAGSLRGVASSSHNLGVLYSKNNNAEAAKLYFIRGHQRGSFDSTMLLYALYSQDKLAESLSGIREIDKIKRNPILALHYLATAADMPYHRGSLHIFRRIMTTRLINYSAGKLIHELRKTHPNSKVLKRAEIRFGGYMAHLDSLDRYDCVKRIVQNSGTNPSPT
jgi:hypothetical protein